MAADAVLKLVDTPRGRYWVPAADDILPFILSEQEHEVYGADAVHKGDIVLDCGANVGTFTQTALRHGAALVVAIEPVPATVEALRRNLAFEIAQHRVIVYPKGVWDKPDQLVMQLTGSNAGQSSVVIMGGDSTISVSLVTIDYLVAELHLPRVDFIKMDIEGAEKQALRGAANTIRTFRPRMSISAEHLPDDYRVLPAVIASIDSNYRVRYCDCIDGGTGVVSNVIRFDHQ